MDYKADKQEGKINAKQQESNEVEKVKFSDVKKLNIMYWLIVLICIFSSGPFWSFYSIINKFFN